MKDRICWWTIPLNIPLFSLHKIENQNWLKKDYKVLIVRLFCIPSRFQKLPPAAELQNVNLFTRSKTFKPNFTRRKSSKFQPFWHQNWTKLAIGILLENRCWWFCQCGIIQTEKSHIDCANLLKKGLILQNCVSFQTFTPTCQYFYTDISVISVTFCNSGGDLTIFNAFYLVCTSILRKHPPSKHINDCNQNANKRLSL